MVEVVRLRHRREFLAAARGLKVPCHGFVLQAVARKEPERAAMLGLGFTVTRKIGNAVVRNRARRRLREAVRPLLPGPAPQGHDLVLVARPRAVDQPFAALQADLAAALRQAARRLVGDRPVAGRHP